MQVWIFMILLFKCLDYKYKLWTNLDITRENFPLTFDLIQLLFEFKKNNKDFRLTTITDLMKL